MELSFLIKTYNYKLSQSQIKKKIRQIEVS